jgi:hypothetical protein
MQQETRHILNLVIERLRADHKAQSNYDDPRARLIAVVTIESVAHNLAALLRCERFIEPDAPELFKLESFGPATESEARARAEAMNPHGDPRAVIAYSSVLLAHDKDPRGEFVRVVLGYAPRDDESALDAYKRLRVEDPDLFPAPRAGESMLDTLRFAIQCHKERG